MTMDERNVCLIDLLLDFRQMAIHSPLILREMGATRVTSSRCAKVQFLPFGGIAAVVMALFKMVAQNDFSCRTTRHLFIFSSRNPG
jgi:hypothetical protein